MQKLFSIGLSVRVYPGSWFLCKHKWPYTHKFIHSHNHNEIKHIYLFRHPFKYGEMENRWGCVAVDKTTENFIIFNHR